MTKVIYTFFIMYVVTSIPIVKGIPKDELTYFSTRAVTVGDVITVAIQSREIRAIVTHVQDAKQMKGAVKQGDFALKKILKVEPGYIPASMIETAREVAKYYVTSMSKVLGAMYPKNVLAEAERTHAELGARSLELGEFKITCIEGKQEDRFAWIQKNILQKDRGVLYISPSNHELAKAKKFFESTSITCTSPEYGFVWLPYVDTIILDHESGAGYYDRSSAKIDFKKVYELHAKKNNQQIIFADSVLGLKYASTQGNLVCSLTPWPKVTVTKKERKVDHTSWLISEEAVKLVKKTLETGGKMFFFALRKSIASMTICGDCGEVVRCVDCKRSLTLARKNSEQIFICPQCRGSTSADVKCVYCDSWKLALLGVTVESVADELEKLFLKAHVLRVSSDVVKTKTALAKIVKQFYATQGALLVGTELAIPYLEQPVSCSVISSIDSFLSGRSLSGTDKAARTIFDVASLATNGVLVETTDPDQQFFEDICHGGGSTSAMLKMYRERELTERKKFNYPPYSMIIKIGVETYFIKKESWPDAKLVEKIRNLPKSDSYEIDADRAV